MCYRTYTRLQPGACSGIGGKLIVTDMDRIEAPLLNPAFRGFRVQGLGFRV